MLGVCFGIYIEPSGASLVASVLVSGPSRSDEQERQAAETARRHAAQPEISSRHLRDVAGTLWTPQCRRMVQLRAT
jgi:hypothetical protein